MSRLKIIFSLLTILFFCSCSDKNEENKKSVQTSAGEISVTLVSRRHYDAGITGAPHAPIILPYVNAEILNAVFISIKGQDSILIDELPEFPSLMTNDQMSEVSSKISITTSPDGKNILYTRAKEKDSSLVIVHRFDDGRMFISGLFEEKYRESVRAKKDFDWKTIPSTNEIAKQVLLDSISDEVRDASLETALLNEKHPSELDFFALDHFGGTNLATTYIEVLATDSFWTNPSSEWSAKVRERIDFVSNQIEKSGKDFDESVVAQPMLQNLLWLEKQSKLQAVIDPIDSLLCRMSFISNKVNDIFFQRIDDNVTIPVSQNIMTYYHKLALKKMDLPETKNGNVIRTANKLNDSILVNSCGVKLLATWPEMANDSANENSLETYYDEFTPSLQAAIRTKAEKYLNTKYSQYASDFLLNNSSCEELFALRKKYPGFINYRADCDTNKVNTYH
jgi:hypothetical protein